MVEEMTMWDKFIDLILMVYHIIKYVITEVILFLLIYDRKAVLPIDESYDLYIRNHMMQIVEEVFNIKKEA